MTPDQLDILLQEGEGTMLEYKEGLSASFARELVAMANTLGGRILLGVRDDGSVLGIGDSNDLRARIQDIARNCDPAIQVLVERIKVISPGGLPKGMTLADLGRKSIRRNALIADLLHRIDFIEKAGTGIRRIRDEVREQGCPEPEFETKSFFTAIFRPNPDVRAQAATHGTPPEAQPGPSQGPVGAQSAQILNALLQTPLAMKELISALSLKSKTGALKRTVNELLSRNWIEYTIPAKPTSRLQKYRITSFGKEALKRNAHMETSRN